MKKKIVKTKYFCGGCRAELDFPQKGENPICPFCDTDNGKSLKTKRILGIILALFYTLTLCSLLAFLTVMIVRTKLLGFLRLFSFLPAIIIGLFGIKNMWSRKNGTDFYRLSKERQFMNVSKVYSVLITYKWFNLMGIPGFCFFLMKKYTEQFAKQIGHNIDRITDFLSRLGLSLDVLLSEGIRWLFKVETNKGNEITGKVSDYLLNPDKLEKHIRLFFLITALVFTALFVFSLIRTIGIYRAANRLKKVTYTDRRKNKKRQVKRFDKSRQKESRYIDLFVIGALQLLVGVSTVVLTTILKNVTWMHYLFGMGCMGIFWGAELFTLALYFRMVPVEPVPEMYREKNKKPAEGQEPQLAEHGGISEGVLKDKTESEKKTEELSEIESGDQVVLTQEEYRALMEMLRKQKEESVSSLVPETAQKDTLPKQDE